MTTSPKLSTLSSSARRALRAAAHHLDPVVMMGQHGLTPAVLHEIDLALTAHALIKVRAGSDERETRDAYLAEICEKLSCESVQHLGKLFVLWRNADGASDADSNAEDDAATVKARHDPQADKTVRGPRTKLASERANERSAAPPPRAGGYGAPRGGAGAGSRGGPPSGPRAAAPGERRRYGEAPPDAPRREGWAPKDRRGAARFGATEGFDDSRRRDGPPAYGAPRGRPPAASGTGYRGTGGGAGSDRGAAGTGGGAGRGGYGGGDQRGSGGYQGGGYQGGGQGRGDAQGDGAPRARWGDRREPAQGGNEGTGGGFGNDRSAPKQRAAYGRNSDTARPPRTGGGYAGSSGAGSGAGGRGGFGSRDAVTGKPSGFSRGGAGGSGTGSGGGGAAPRARRRFG